MISGRNALSYSGNVIVGTSNISGKGFSLTQYGYGDSSVAVAGSTFGSRSPTTTSGFTIIGMFWQTSTGSSGISSLIVTGDSSSKYAAMSVAGVDQQLGAGTYTSGNNRTTYASVSSIANSFGTSGTVVVTLS